MAPFDEIAARYGLALVLQHGSTVGGATHPASEAPRQAAGEVPEYLAQVRAFLARLPAAVRP